MSNKVGGYTTASLRRGDRYKSTEFDQKIDAVVFIPPDRSRVITDSEHVIIDVLPAPEDMALDPEKVAWSGFIVAFVLILGSVWVTMVMAWLFGFHR